MSFVCVCCHPTLPFPRDPCPRGPPLTKITYEISKLPKDFKISEISLKISDFTRDFKVLARFQDFDLDFADF